MVMTEFLFAQKRPQLTLEIFWQPLVHNDPLEFECDEKKVATPSYVSKRCASKQQLFRTVICTDHVV
jgi:hypothetical protein